MFTVLVVPALSLQAGQCRIRAIPGNFSEDALGLYRANPENWREVGLVNSAGKLLAVHGPKAFREELEDCQPLSGGLVLVTNEKLWEDQ